ncbi:uncharacterized protein LOC112126485 [Cimex lectularius]|uniref:Uncharacterized protein n=1 Tax=Cimex lectularius TaxID=79782 RepID=A0A8I6SM62_CIMLE|nr:uncharacterized protein LOC112126485 [Cimex lectularius]
MISSWSNYSVGDRGINYSNLINNERTRQNILSNFASFKADGEYGWFYKLNTLIKRLYSAAFLDSGAFSITSIEFAQHYSYFAESTQDFLLASNIENTHRVEFFENPNLS